VLDFAGTDCYGWRLLLGASGGRESLRQLVLPAPRPHLPPLLRRGSLVLIAVAAVLLVGCASATTDPATKVTDDSARLNGHVNPNGATTTYWFEHGKTTAYGDETEHRDAGSGTTNVAVSELLGGLTANTTYHYRLCAVSEGTTVCGDDRAFTTAPAAARLRPGFRQSTVVSGLDKPTSVRFSPDGRVFVAERSGLVKVFDSFADATPDIFADLRTKVHNYWDRGLVGLELDPRFPTDPYVYVLYSHDAAIGGTAPRWGIAGQTSDSCPDPGALGSSGCVISGRLSRLEASGNAMVGAEKVLIEGWCQQAPNHTVGALEFGPDGALYASGGEGASGDFADYGQRGGNPCGDPPVPVGGQQTLPTTQGGALRSQDLRTAGDPAGLSGTIIRVDPSTGAGLPTNPMATSSDPNLRRIIAYGLRNPYRFTIRPGTSEVWIGDVGWNTYEEIDRIVNPTDATVENFGWPCYEGSGRQPTWDSLNVTLCENLYAQSGAVTGPFFTYPKSAQVIPGESCASGSAAVSGLAFQFYGGGPYPPEYDGALFFADYTRNCIWAIKRSGGTLPSPSAIETFVSGASAPVDLQLGPNGDLFYTDYVGGTVRRISYSAGNQAPEAKATANPSRGDPPLTVSFDAGDSSDADPGDTLNYVWDLDGDGAYDDSTSISPSFTYSTPGRHTATVLVGDNHGAFDADSVDVSVGPPSVRITAPSASSTWAARETISFAGSATDGQDGALPASALRWSVILHHCLADCHEHFLQSFEGVASGSFAAPDHDYPAYLEVRLTAEDSDGLTSSDSLQLSPRTAELTLESTPTGASLGVNETTARTPFRRTVILGSTVTLIAISPQNIGGSGPWNWQSWSDGGARVHSVVVNGNATYRATFRGP
jgi:glucose/arabinose dehydrogenase